MQNYIDPRQLGLVRAITTQAVAADTEVLSDAINMEGWEYLIYVVNGGTNAATSGTVTVVIKESATIGGTYTAVSGSSFTYATTDDGVYRYGIMKASALTVGSFAKVSVTGGTGGTFTAGIDCILVNSKDTAFYTAALACVGSGDVVTASVDIN